MKALVFDTSSVITLATNNLLWLLNSMKKKFNGKFYIAKNVKEELIDNPIRTKKFELEALAILDMFNENYLEMIDNKQIEEKTRRLFNLANNIFGVKDKYLKLVHDGEMNSLALSIILNATYVVDERTTRLLIENPDNLHDLLEKKLHATISINKQNLEQFKKETSNVRIIRSAELLVIAYEQGLLNSYITTGKEKFHSELKKTLLNGLLWGAKLRGCSISTQEIEDIMKLEGF